MRKIAGGAVALALLLVGCGSSSGDGASSASPTVAKATNYTLACNTKAKQSFTLTDYHDGWGKNVYYCDGKMTGALTPDQDAAAALETETTDSPARTVLTVYGTCAEDGSDAYFDPNGSSWQDDPATIPAAALATHVADLKTFLALCPDHPFADGWKRWLDKVPKTS